MSYSVGSTYTTSISLYDADDTLADPDSITLTFTLPDGTDTSPIPVHESTGLYYYDYVTTQAGLHQVYWLTTGANADSLSDSFYVEPAEWSGLVGIQDAKDYLNKTTDTDDDELADFILAATAAIESYCNRRFRSSPETLTFNGSEFMDAIPLPAETSAVASVTENGTALAGTGFAFDASTSLLYRLTSNYGSWPWQRGVQNVTVELTRGSDSLPADVRHACLSMVKHLWETQRGNQPTVLGGGGETEWNPIGTYSIPRRVQELIDPYRVPAFL